MDPIDLTNNIIKSVDEQLNPDSTQEKSIDFANTSSTVNVSEPAKRAKTTTVSLDEIKDTPSEMKVNFLGPNQDPNDFMSQPTKKYDDTQPIIQSGGSQAKDSFGNDFLNQAQSSEKKPLEFFKPIAGMILKVWNISLSNFCKWLAKDTSSEDYIIPKDQIDGLSDMGAEIMYMYQKKVNPMWVWLGAFFVFSALPVIAAWDKKKIIKKIHADRAAATPIAKTPVYNTPKNTPPVTQQNYTNPPQSQSVHQPIPAIAQNTISTLPTKIDPESYMDNGKGELVRAGDFIPKVPINNYTQQELDQGYYFTKKGKKLPIKYGLDSLPIKKIGKQPRVST